MVEEDEREINDRTDDKVNKNKEYCGKMRDAKKRKKNNDDMTCAARARWQNNAMALKFSFSILILILADGKQTAADAHLC